ncbi:MAG: crotonobetainyl-CoA:carnitine CoA-transferase CaiB-like acyl-CoA transferase [Alphaproteobacteria bacterium]|jgi:crotonobetainyl-CoA:carnitine CoA-transferase CaiB-like acyl-CoA transferase
MGYDAPFKDIKVVDLSQGVAGPYSAMLLAQYGANVIKVEPHDGDWSRFISTRFEDHSAFSVPANLGKRSIALDLKSEDAKDAVRRFIADADVFIEGFRPGVIDRLGFGYDAVSKINPGIIYLSISGFGQSGPYRERPAMDPILQAFTGLMSQNKGFDDIPHRVGVIVSDMTTSLYAFQSVAVSLYAKRDEPKGRHIDVSLMQGTACLQVIRMIMTHMAGGEAKPGRVPAGSFETSDGWIYILLFKESEWAPLCEMLDLNHLRDDPRYVDNASRMANQDTLMPIVQAAFKGKTSDYWCEHLTNARTMHEKVNEYADFLKHPQVEAMGLITWLDQPGIGRVPVPNAPGIMPLEPGTPLAMSPIVGEHSEAILQEHGYSDADIAALISDGVVKIA